jgi:hypothetical protein
MIMVMGGLRTDTMSRTRSPTVRPSNRPKYRRSTPAGLVGYPAVLAVGLALLTAPAVVGAGLAVAGPAAVVVSLAWAVAWPRTPGYSAGVDADVDRGVDPSVVPGATLVDDPADLADYPEWYDEFPLVAYRCRRCGVEPTADLGTALADHPAVVGFHYDRGVDIRERTQWELVAWDPDRARIRERDPLRAAVTYTVDGDDCTLVVDDALDVQRVDRSDG